MPYFSRHGGWSRKANTTLLSGSEEKIKDELENARVKYEYEKHRVDYTLPSPIHHYTPDFVLENGIIIEVKGRFDSKDRAKHIAIKNQHPDLDIRFVFDGKARYPSRTKISKISKTTYGIWCEKHGFMYADHYIPLEWLKEKKKPLPKKDIYKRGEKNT